MILFFLYPLNFDNGNRVKCIINSTALYHLVEIATDRCCMPYLSPAVHSYGVSKPFGTQSGWSLEVRVLVDLCGAQRVSSVDRGGR